MIRTVLAFTLLFFSLESLAAEAPESSGLERSCHENAPRLEAADMVKNGFVVHYLQDGQKEYVRLDYVFADRLYYRFKGMTWRAIYLAHPSGVIQRTPTSASIMCGYVIGFSIDSEGSRSGHLQWVFLHDAVFVETP